MPESNAGMAVPLTSRTESTTASLTDREQLLKRIAELEQQRKEMELQRDQAVLSQMRNGSERQAPTEKPERYFIGDAQAMPMVPEHNPGISAASKMQPHEQSAMELTEALLCQMHASNASDGGSTQMSRETEPYGIGGCRRMPPDMQDALAAAAVARMPQHPQDALAATTSTSAAEPPFSAVLRSTENKDERIATVPSETQACLDIYQELERMEIELRKVREENIRLKEDKEACEAAHSRDVSTLEAMLEQMMLEKQRLTKALAETESLLSRVSKLEAGIPISGMDKLAHSKNVQGSPLTPHSIRSVSEPAIEPDIERSIEFDRSKLNVAAVGSRYPQLA